MIRKPINFLPQRIGGQIALVVAAAVLLAHGLTFVVFTSLLPPPISPLPAAMSARIVALASVLEAFPPSTRMRVVSGTDFPNMSFTWSTTSPAAGGHIGRPRSPLARLVMAQLTAGQSVQEQGPAEVPGWPSNLRLGIRLRDGSWLAVSVAMEALPPGAILSLVPALTALATVTLALSLWAALRLVQPLATLARAAEAFEIGNDPPCLAEAGPLEVRRAARALNRMQARIRAEVAERSGTLAAVSHDLRAPLARLRLRIDALENHPLQDELRGDVARMERMIGTALSFLRGQGGDEPVTSVDLPSLLQTVCNEAADLGREVAYTGPAQLAFSCRHDAIVRAVGNLVANALSFGSHVEVYLKSTDDGVIIDVGDDGPGIPTADRDRMFQPFIRGDMQRDPARPGFGLGLAIVRAIAEAHGGRIELLERSPSGTVARLYLAAC